MAYDPESGYYYDNARYYDGFNGRFISVDPIAFKSGQTNLYVYCGDNPINRVDPTGLLKVMVIFEGAGFLGANTLYNALGSSYNLIGSNRIPYSGPGERKGDTSAWPNQFVYMRFGTGDWPSPNDNGVQEALKDIQPFLRPHDCGKYDTIAVVGHSWGGDAAAEFVERLSAQNHGARVNLIGGWPGSKSGGATGLGE